MDNPTSATRPQTRPDGPLIWVHVPREGGLMAVVELLHRLKRAHGHLSALVTTPAPVPQDAPDGIVFAPPPDDRRSSITAFLDHWAPDAVVWTRGHLMRTTLGLVADRKVPLFLVDAGLSGFEGVRGGWLPGSMRGTLRRFDRILTMDDATLQRLKTLGGHPWTMERTGALEESALTLPHDEDDRQDLAAALSTRPVWFAADLPQDEYRIAISAHVQALRRGHRFLLIVAPASDADLNALETAASEAGLRTTRRSQRLLPDEDDQVFIADTDDERGLYYRVAPITYVGGTLTGGRNVSPFEAAALGSALIHGNAISRFRHAFDRLGQANAARAIRLPELLGVAITDLSAPDKAASLAHAAWDVASSGAAVTDRVISLITAALPMREADPQ